MELMLWVIQVVLCFNALQLHKDVAATDTREIFISSDERHRGFFQTGTESNFPGARPIRERRPGGLSYETPYGRETERRGKALERRQMKYAKRLGKMVAKFSERLIKQLLEGPVTKDVVVSPLAVHMALSMASVGARGSNLKELNKVIGLRRNRFGKGNIHHVYFTMRSQLLLNRPDVDVFDVLGVFVKPRIPLEVTFRQTVSQFYNGHLGTFPVSPVAGINSWVSDRTRGEMTTFLPPRSVKAHAQMVLTSGMCIKGHWNAPFGIKPGRFHTINGEMRNVDMIEQVMLVKKLPIDLPHTTLTRLQVVLSTGDNKRGDLVLDIVQLNCSSNVQDAVEALTSKAHSRSLQRQTAKQTRLTLPKFWIRESVSANDFKRVLTKLKMRKAFRKKKANFQGISSTGSLYLQKFFHQAAFQLNEYGIGCNTPLNNTTFSTGTPPNFQHAELRKSPSRTRTHFRSGAKERSRSSAKDNHENLPTVNVDRFFVFAIRETKYNTHLTAGIFTGAEFSDAQKMGGFPLDERNAFVKPIC